MAENIAYLSLDTIPLISLNLSRGNNSSTTGSDLLSISLKIMMFPPAPPLEAVSTATI